MGYLYLVFITLCIVGAYRLSRRRKYLPGLLSLSNGHKYSYIIGDNLPAEAVTFHGLDILLPHALPDFYLDASRDSKHHGPAMRFARGQQVALEGDFNTYFRLFLPRGTQVDVLSVLSPDVMQTLMQKGSHYDVQLHQNHLRIISPVPVYEKDSYQVDLKWAAEAILPEIDHRLASWRPSDSSAELVYKPGVTLKLGSHYIRMKQLLWALLAIDLSIIVGGFGLALYYTWQNPNFLDPYSKGRLAGLLINGAVWCVIGTLLLVLLVALFWFRRHQGKTIDYLRAVIGL